MAKAEPSRSSHFSEVSCQGSDAPFLLTPDGWFLLGSPGPVTAGFACGVMLCGLLRLRGSTDLIPRALHVGHLWKVLLAVFRPHWTRSNRLVAVFISVSAILYVACHHKDLDHQSCPFQLLYTDYNIYGCRSFTTLCEGLQGSVGDPCVRARCFADPSYVSIPVFSNTVEM